jgi:hypothetical protein
MHVPLTAAQTELAHLSQLQSKSTPTNVSSTCATERTDLIPETLTVMTRTHVPLILATAQPEFAPTRVNHVMTTMHVPEIAAILQAETVSTPQCLALMEMHVPLIPVMQSRDASTLQNTT